MRIAELLDIYHRFADKVVQINALDVTSDEITPPAESEIEQLAADFNLQIPTDIRYFWQHFRQELNGGSLPDAPNFFSVGFDFYNLQHQQRDLPDFRSLANIYEEMGETRRLEYKLYTTGLPLSFSEPQLVHLPANNNIYWIIYDGETPKLPIARSFTEFFEHYLAAGCFAGHYFPDYWKIIEPFAPLDIPPSENKWLKFYQKIYELDFARFIK